MKKNIIIINDVNFHLEIIESIIYCINNILKINDLTLDKYNIFLTINTKDISFLKYIKQKYSFLHINYKNIRLLKKDYVINVTIYDNDYDKLIKNSNTYFYISHNISERLKKLNNVYFLTPLSKKCYINCIKLPFNNYKKIKTNIPIFLVQGNICEKRRDLKLLKIMFDYFSNNNDKSYNKKIKIKILGRGKIPNYLIPYRDKIILKNNLNFIDFHKEFLDIYCILPLLNYNKTPQYYKTKLTSTINYIKAYNLQSIIDEKLNNIYKLNNVMVYNNNNEFINCIKCKINEFYSNK